METTATSLNDQFKNYLKQNPELSCEVIKEFVANDAKTSKLKPLEWVASHPKSTL
jgi:hypothetical protein